jgi:SOS-response transcriptional repressor LexA
MLKRLAILGLLSSGVLVGAQNPVPPNGGKQQEQPQTHSDVSQPNASTATPPSSAEQDASTGQKEANKESKANEYLKEAFAAANLSNWVLAVLGIIGGLAAVRSLVLIRRQAEIMETQAKDARESGVEATKIALTTAQAAEKSAEAANAQIQFMKNKERARISITFPDGSESMTIYPDKIVSLGSFRLILKNVGSSVATNIAASYDAFAAEPTESGNAPKSEGMCLLEVPYFVEGNSYEETGPLTIDGRFAAGNAPDLFYVYLRVIVEYSDLFKTERNVATFAAKRGFQRRRIGEAVADGFWQTIGSSEDTVSA